MEHDIRCRLNNDEGGFSIIYRNSAKINVSSSVLLVLVGGFSARRVSVI